MACDIAEASPFKNVYLFLFLAALGLCCCVWAFSSCREWGLRFVMVHGLPVAVVSRLGAQRASVVAARRL